MVVKKSAIRNIKLQCLQTKNLLQMDQNSLVKLKSQRCGFQFFMENLHDFEQYTKMMQNTVRNKSSLRFDDVNTIMNMLIP